MFCWFLAFLGRSIGDFTLSYFAYRADKHQGGILDKKATKFVSAVSYSLKPWLETTRGRQQGWLWLTKGILLHSPSCFPRPCHPADTAVSITKSEKSEQKSDIRLVKKRDNIFGWLTLLDYHTKVGINLQHLQTLKATGWVGESSMGH